MRQTINMQKKINILLLFVVIVFISFITSSCYFDKEEILYPETPCDTITKFSYSNDVVPILSVNCYSCHSLVNAPIYGENLVLEGYANLSRFLNDEPDVLLDAMKQNGKALKMPRDGSKVSKCDISNIEVWIKQGQRNN